MAMSMAGVTTLGDLASAIGMRAEEAAVLAELKAGSEEAYAWLIAQYHQPIYSLIYRLLNDPADAADVTQEVFLKVFRGMKRFHGDSSLKTWIYRITLREASNHRRWWFRHKARETSMEPMDAGNQSGAPALTDVLVDDSSSPFDNLARSELHARVEQELRHVPEPYRSTVILRDLEELSYEEIAEVMETSLGTVKSRLMRGRVALRKRLQKFIDQAGPELGIGSASGTRRALACGPEVEVTP